jgi:hypothetical protein
MNREGRPGRSKKTGGSGANECTLLHVFASKKFGLPVGRASQKKLAPLGRRGAGTESAADNLPLH